MLNIDTWYQLFQSKLFKKIDKWRYLGAEKCTAWKVTEERQGTTNSNHVNRQLQL